MACSRYRLWIRDTTRPGVEEGKKSAVEGEERLERETVGVMDVLGHQDIGMVMIGDLVAHRTSPPSARVTAMIHIILCLAIHPPCVWGIYLPCPAGNSRLCPIVTPLLEVVAQAEENAVLTVAVNEMNVMSERDILCGSIVLLPCPN